MAKVSYEILEFNKGQVLVRNFSGIIKVTDNLESFQYLREFLMNDPVIGLISNFEVASMNFQLSNLSEILQHIKAEPPYQTMKLAVVVNSP